MRVQDIDSGLQELERELFSAIMDPEPSRPDWPERKARLATMCDKATALFEALERASKLLGASERESWPRRAGEVASQLVAVLHAADDSDARATMIRAGLRVAPVGPLQDELEAARRAPKLHLALARARWLHDRDRHDEARVQLDKVIAGDEPVLTAAAELVEVVDAPAMWTSIPRGLGFTLLGHDEVRPDGSYLATYCMQVLWIPLVPLARYRVRKTADGLVFMRKFPISHAARWYLRLMVGGLLALVGGVVVMAVLNNPANDFGAGEFDDAMAEAGRLERSGQLQAAERRYAEIDEARLGWTAQRLLAHALVRVHLKRDPSPTSADALTSLAVLTGSIRAMDPRSWRDGVGPTLAAHLVKVAHALERQGDQGVDQALVLLEDAAVLGRAPDAAPLRAYAAKLRLVSAKALASEWPLQAIERLDRLGNDENARKEQGQLLVQVSQVPGLIGEVEPAARAYLRWAATRTELASEARKLDRALEVAGAMAMDATRNRAIESGEASALTTALHEHPTDQALLAERAFAGADADSAAALAQVDKLGRAGWLLGHARLVRIGLSSRTGDLARAEDLLTHEVAFRLPHHRAAMAALETEYRALLDRLAPRFGKEQASGQAMAQVIVATEADRERAFLDWAAPIADKDDRIIYLRDVVGREAGAIDLALQLGTLQLTLASAAPLDKRATLLASAERSFLAIAGDASDRPAYHLGLGQAHYRLGRIPEAQRELDGLLTSDDPAVHLDVATAYRNVGLSARAREILIAASKRDEPWRTPAVLMLAVMAADVEEKASWLGQGDRDHPEVKRGLRKVAAERSLLAGRLEEADQLLATMIADMHKEPVTLSLINDEALALSDRFEATGRAEFLDQAAAALARVQKLAPDDPILLANLIGLLQGRARITVLGKRVALPRLRPLGYDHAASVVEAFLDGSEAEAVRTALVREPAEMRAVDLLHSLEALAPFTPMGYRLEFAASEVRKDVAGLTTLAGRVRAQELDTSEVDAGRERWRRGELDAMLRADAHSTLATHKAAATDHDLATAATAQLIIAAQLATLAQLDVAPASARDAVTALRSAARWKVLGVQRQLALTLLLQAMLEAAASDPNVDLVLRRDRRDFPESQLLAHLPASARASLATRPEVVEAITLLRAAAARDPHDTDLVVARALGDAELERLARPVIDDPLKSLQRELALLLDPHSPSAAEMAALKP